MAVERMGLATAVPRAVTHIDEHRTVVARTGRVTAVRRAVALTDNHHPAPARLTDLAMRAQNMTALPTAATVRP